MTLPLFLYGTLLDARTLARHSGERGLPRRLRPARLVGWRRVMLRGTPYPTLLRDPAGVVAGALCRPGAAALRRLAAYEGASYRLLPVCVYVRVCVGPSRPRRARAWAAPRWRAEAVDHPAARSGVMAAAPSSAASGIGRPSR